jgi:phosphoglucosamine mutase
VLEADHGRRCRVALGRDTRESGAWLRDAVGGGLASRGAAAVDAGVITTPGLAHVLRAHGFDAGVMISASHNPFQDNGLKVFGHTGMKLSDEMERRVEDLILDETIETPAETQDPVAEDGALSQGYTEHLESAVGGSRRFAGMRVVLDCANGSACSIAPAVFRRYGAELTIIGDRPDGRNINLDCGTLHLDRLARAVKNSSSRLGIAFDGDGDRALAVDREGRTVDGDHILYIIARWLRKQGRLRGNAVVATIMSNLWLEKRLADSGIALHRTSVGDKYVLERMVEKDLVLGGEQSGHLIFREQATTGDGILTGLLLLAALQDENRTLGEFLDEITPFPQVQLNVRVTTKPDLRKHAKVGPAVSEIEQSLGERGRVVLRYSGTEPVARIMVEGLDADAVRRHAERLAGIVAGELGEG